MNVKGKKGPPTPKRSKSKRNGPPTPKSKGPPAPKSKGPPAPKSKGPPAPKGKGPPKPKADSELGATLQLATSKCKGPTTPAKKEAEAPPVHVSAELMNEHNKNLSMLDQTIEAEREKHKRHLEERKKARKTKRNRNNQIQPQETIASNPVNPLTSAVALAKDQQSKQKEDTAVKPNQAEKEKEAAKASQSNKKGATLIEVKAKDSTAGEAAADDETDKETPPSIKNIEQVSLSNVTSAKSGAGGGVKKLKKMGRSMRKLQARISKLENKREREKLKVEEEVFVTTDPNTTEHGGKVGFILDDKQVVLVDGLYEGQYLVQLKSKVRRVLPAETNLYRYNRQDGWDIDGNVLIVDEWSNELINTGDLKRVKKLGFLRTMQKNTPWAFILFIFFAAQVLGWGYLAFVGYTTRGGIWYDAYSAEVFHGDRHEDRTVVVQPGY